MILVIDTETSGKADFKAPYYAQHQPRMLSFCGLLYREDGTLVNQAAMLVRHKDIEIEPGAAQVNGLTKEILEKEGLPLSVVLSVIDSMIQLAHVICAFNTQFDFLILDSEFFRARRLPQMQEEFNSSFDEFCCMRRATPLCKIPSPYHQGEYKWPNLQEAHRFFFGEDFKGAHGALADALACARIYFHIINLSQQNKTS